MKQLRLIFIFLLIVQINNHAQTPQAINYQAVIRNAFGQSINDPSLSIRVRIMHAAPNGVIVFEETYNNQSAVNGMVGIKIGSVNQADFESIDWAQGPYFLAIDYDLDDGVSFSNTTPTQIMSVPYALYADKAGDSFWEGNETGDIFRLTGKTGCNTNKPLSTFYINSSEFGKRGGLALRSLDAHTILNHTEVNGSNAGYLQVYSGSNENQIGSNPYTFLIQPDGGRVGVNSFDAASAMMLKSNIFGKTGGFSLNNIDGHLSFYYVDNNGGNNPVIQTWAGGNSGSIGESPYNLLLQPEGGGVNINTFTSPPPNIALNVNGITRTTILEITGGDVAEARHSTGNYLIKPGMVVVFDESDQGKIRLTNLPYDPKVAGVISGEGNYYAGICLLEGELKKGALPVAQTGTVEVLCIGPVSVGDLLTTSHIPGHAMSIKKKKKGIGCTIGKAVKSLKSGETGLVEMQIEKH